MSSKHRCRINKIFTSTRSALGAVRDYRNEAVAKSGRRKKEKKEKKEEQSLFGCESEMI